MVITKDRVPVGLGTEETLKRVCVKANTLGRSILLRIHKALEQANDGTNNRHKHVALRNLPDDVNLQLEQYVKQYGASCQIDELKVGEIVASEDGRGVTMKLEDDIMVTIIPQVVNDDVPVLYIEVRCNPQGFVATSTRRDQNLIAVFDALCTSNPYGRFD